MHLPNAAPVSIAHTKAIGAPHWTEWVTTAMCLVQFYELARKEIGALILSDEHPNIVRCFAMEEDNEFVYLALERCRHSLNDLMNTEDGPPAFVDDARRPTAFCIQARLSTCNSTFFLTMHGRA